MKFTVSFSTSVVDSRDLADVTVKGLPGSFELKLQQPASVSQEFEVPADKSIEFWVGVYFRRAERHVEVEAEATNALGLALHQTSSERVLADITHPPITMGGQCTVSCPTTGEHRSGTNVCIECGTPRGTVRICC
jgi:hypothetical protein